MGLVILIIILLGFAVGLMVIGKNYKKRKDEYSQYSTLGKILSGVGVGLTALSVIILAWNSFFLLDAGEAAVVKSVTGEVSNESIYSENGGAHLKAPWDSVTEFSVRNRQVVFQAQGGDDVNITASTKDNASVYMDVTFSYNQDSQRVVEIYKTYHNSDEMRTQLIRDARSALQLAPAKIATMEIKQKRSELEASFMADLKQKLEQKYGVDITTVSLRSMWFTDEVQKSLDAVQARNAEVEQARAKLEQSKITAEVTKTDAQAQADADQIIRCGARTEKVKETINGVETESIKTFPLTGDQCQNRLNEQVLTSKYIEALKEIANKQGNVIITDGKTVPIVNIPNAAK